MPMRDLPEPFAGQSGTIGIRITADSAHRTIGLIWRTDRTLPAPAARSAMMKA
ncbi:hypothetical protein [Actinospica sp.]|uniref:hypothetical protein n=1 Tax=Actinospica sp. TaxID=1872142 RepID=UPI002CBEC36F|nr:hypothetical protein [Actinospica sp.]HWG25259.1 hypothetical protein [Actinospica sp.]